MDWGIEGALNTIVAKERISGIEAYLDFMKLASKGQEVNDRNATQKAIEYVAPILIFVVFITNTAAFAAALTTILAKR